MTVAAIIIGVLVGVTVAAFVHAVRELRWLRRIERASGDPVELARLLRRRRVEL